MGIFNLENKVVKAAQVMDLMRAFAGNPGFDMIAAGKYVAVNLQGIDEAANWFINPGLAMPPGMPPGVPPPLPGMPLPPEMVNPPAPGAPGMKGGPNGNQPNFLPPNPLRRVPVT
jgi:hypothetical protein